MFAPRTCTEDMGTEGTRARSHAHGKRHGRLTVHLVVVTLALLAVTFAARFPDSSSARPGVVTPTFALSGVTGTTRLSGASFFQPGSSHQTRQSVAALTTQSDIASVRAAGGISPVSSFTSGVSAAAVSTGEQGAGVQPLADIVDPQKPFVLYTVVEGDTPIGIAEKFGISVGTLLDNNPTADEILLVGQEMVVPRRDGILHKVGFGETVDSIVGQYDNITSEQVISYRPNAIADPNGLEQGKYLLLLGATVKPPPPPPPPPPAPAPVPVSPGGGSSGGGAPLPGAFGIFSFPLAAWHGVSDPFGVPRGSSYHTGIDLDLWGYHNVPVYAACDGQVIRTEWLTYSYGYHVIVDCGGGFTTLYAHFDRIDVSAGQWVTAGTQLGISGLTGYTTGEHLHFEIRVSGAPVNPAAYLPF